MQVNNIGVIGAGIMGSGIAQVYAARGYPVVIRYISDEAINRGLQTIEKSLDRLLAKNKITADEKNITQEQIQATTDMSLLASSDVVIEAANENVDLKLNIFRELEHTCKPETILATNTSSISITKIAGAIQRPERVIGMHFMNPVPVMQLIEIIRALQTFDEAHAVIEDLARRVGKTPVTVKDSFGFISNRLLIPMINEAAYCLHEGLAPREDIDTVMKLDPLLINTHTSGLLTYQLLSCQKCV